MEFLTGRKEKEVLELKSLLSYGKTGQEVKVNGAVMNIRNMGDIAFIILRKRDGVLQTVFEKGVTKAELSQLKEETFVEVTGFVEPEERAPHGVELRLTGVRILSRPVILSNSSGLASDRLFSLASATIASPSGCSDICSQLAATRSSSDGFQPCSAKISVTFGLPSVIVPVLSRTTVSTL